MHWYSKYNTFDVTYKDDIVTCKTTVKEKLNGQQTSTITYPYPLYVCPKLEKMEQVFTSINKP